MAMRRATSSKLLLIVTAALTAGLLAAPAVQAAPARNHGPGIGTVGSATLAGPASAPGPASAAAPTAPCAFKGIGTCASVNPKISTYVTYTGIASACDFTWKIHWGDGSKVKKVVQNGPSDGQVFLARHTYGTRRQAAYTIAVDGTVKGASGCFVNSGDFRFTLLAYVALGDSYSAGDGADAYLAGTGFGFSLFGGNECLRSANAYPELVDQDLGNSSPNEKKSATFVFRACTGAVISDFTNRQLTADKRKVRAQLATLNGSPGGVGLVTLTIGGNDAGFGPIMRYCATRTAKNPSCKDHSQQAVDAVLATIEPKLTALYKQIKSAKGVAKDATILVLGYPKFFPAGRSKSCATGDPFHKFMPSDMAWINGVIKRFDAKIAAAAKTAGVTYVNVYNAFARHELCASDPDLHEVVILPLSHHQLESFHPTAQGQKVLAVLTEQAIR